MRGEGIKKTAKERKNGAVMTKEQEEMILLFKLANEKLTKGGNEKLKNDTIKILKNKKYENIENRKEILIYLIEHQDNNFINALYIKAIALLQLKK